MTIFMRLLALALMTLTFKQEITAPIKMDGTFIDMTIQNMTLQEEQIVLTE